MRTLDPTLVAAMAREIGRLARRYAETESKADRARRDDAIASWRRRLGPGSLSEIARRAEMSRVQVGRIWAAHREAERTGQPIRPSRHYYQSARPDPAGRH